MPQAYKKLIERVRDIGRLTSIHALLDWDQETCMPPGAVSARADQTSMIAGLAHEWLIADETQELLAQTTPSKDDHAAQANLRELRRAVDRAVRVPTELVKEISRVSSLARDSWGRARSTNEFGKFAPHLSQLLELKKRQADAIGYKTERYDALMDEFEPGAKSADIEKLFAQLREVSVNLLNELTASPGKPDPSILTRHYPRDRQERLCRSMAEALNFDFEAGRMDVSAHPFCSSVGGSCDVRVTTRYMENFLPSAMFGTMHEVGHALYEQGLLRDHMFTPMAEPISLGIHESQSRLWENMVGRSRSFWEYHFEPLQKLFPESLGDVKLEGFYRAINHVEPSLIRVEADELTYNLHIILRFEIERGLLEGDIEVADLPSAWNEKFKQMLGITPPDDSQGCLQDIHWSMGALGYFPTYTLGNLYAAQFFEQAGRDVPDLPGQIAANNHRPLLEWLRSNIHVHGQRYRAHELVQQVTGRPLSIEPFVKYVSGKFKEVYGL